MRHRPGWTLIELTAVIATSSVLFGIALGLLIMLMQVDRSWREQVRGHATAARLADQFRRDVHAAQRVAPLAATGKAGPGWQLHSASGQVVEYRATPGHLLRVQLVDGKTVQQEDFRLSGEATACVQPPEAGAGLVSLKITSGQNPDNPLGRGPLEVEAVLDRDRRFSAKERKP